MNKMNIWMMTGMMALLTACSDPPRSPEQIVAERAQAHWDALIARDPASAYEYQTPGYREKTSVLDHAVKFSRRQITWTAAEIKSVECTEERCMVKLLVSYRADGAPGVLSGMAGRRPIEEIWLQIDDEWWYSSNA